MRISKNSYFHYKDFFLNKQKLNYNDMVDGELLASLDYIYRECYNREFSYYRRVSKKNGDIPTDWQDELKQLLTTSGLSDKKGNKLVAKSFTEASNAEEFEELLVQNLHDELDKGQLSLIYDPITKTLEKTIKALYKSLYTRNEQGTLHITKTKVTGSNTTTIEGWITEIAQGVLNPNKASTAKTELRFVADYVVDGVGLEETKRGIKTDKNATGNTILDSKFHIGSFSISTIGKGKRLKYLRQLLAECVAHIIAGTVTNDRMKIAEARKIFFRNFSILIAGYLSERLLTHTTKKEIFYFASGTNIMLGSEFISAIEGLNKMYIYGNVKNPSAGSSATISKTASVEQLVQMGLASILDDLHSLDNISFSSELNFDKKSTKVLTEKIESSYKGGSFLTAGKFDLWYGKKF